MALQTINVGDFVNDGTGDDLRTAFIKINENFEEIDLLGGQNNTISNVGTGVGIYKEKLGVDLRLKSLVAGPGITLTNNSMDITITNNRNMILTVNANTGSITAQSATQAINIVGGEGITTSIVGSTLTINGNDYTLSTDTSPTLGGNLNLNGYNIVGSGNILANITGLVNGIDVRDLWNAAYTFDFGRINNQAESPYQWITLTNIFDMGTLTNPNSLGIEGGTF